MTKRDLGFILNELHDVRHKWMNIGLQLRVDYSVLLDIEKEQDGNDPNKNRHLRLMLTNAIEVHSITWKDICEALSSRSVGETVLSQTLMKTAKTQGTSLKCDAHDSHDFVIIILHI